LFFGTKMANEKEKWHWQEPGSAWKGVGIYHVTMVIPSRKPLLGRLVIHENDPTQARVELTPFGNEIKECMRTIPEYHPEVRIIGLRMMPDHVHIILYVTRTMKVGIKTVVRGFWQGVKKIGRAYAASILPNAFGKMNDAMKARITFREMNDAMKARITFGKMNDAMKARITFGKMNDA